MIWRCRWVDRRVEPASECRQPPGQYPSPYLVAANVSLLAFDIPKLDEDRGARALREAELAQLSGHGYRGEVGQGIAVQVPRVSDEEGDAAFVR